MVNDGLFLLLALMTLLVMFLYAVITLSPEDAIRTEPPVLNPPAPPPPSPGSRWPQTPRSQLPRPVCVPKTSSTSCDQAIFVDQATDACPFTDAVLAEIDRLG